MKLNENGMPASLIKFIKNNDLSNTTIHSLSTYNFVEITKEQAKGLVKRDENIIPRTDYGYFPDLFILYKNSLIMWQGGKKFHLITGSDEDYDDIYLLEPRTPLNVINTFGDSCHFYIRDTDNSNYVYDRDVDFKKKYQDINNNVINKTETFKIKYEYTDTEYLKGYFRNVYRDLLKKSFERFYTKEELQNSQECLLLCYLLNAKMPYGLTLNKKMISSNSDWIISCIKESIYNYILDMEKMSRVISEVKMYDGYVDDTTGEVWAWPKILVKVLIYTKEKFIDYVNHNLITKLTQRYKMLQEVKANLDVTVYQISGTVRDIGKFIGYYNDADTYISRSSLIKFGELDKRVGGFKDEITSLQDSLKNFDDSTINEINKLEDNINDLEVQIKNLKDVLYEN